VNPIAWVQGLEGTTLIAVICALMFFEEAGVPIPFAPGDVVLAIGGIAIAGGRVNPATFIVVVTASVLIGALAGREIFALLGWERLMRAAQPLHARMPLAHASRLLQLGYEAPVALVSALAGLAVAGLSLSIAVLMGEQLPTIMPGRAFTTAIPVELLIVPLGFAVAWMETGRFLVLYRHRSAGPITSGRPEVIPSNSTA
jgi:hypothetical protein